MNLELLVLMRHAKADPAFAGGDDLGRGLTQSGYAEATQTLEALIAKDYVPDIVLTSPARRTLETWKVAKTLISAEVKIIEGLYLAEPEALLNFIHMHTEPGKKIAIIGHNPGLHQLALNFLSTHTSGPSATLPIYSGMPTASAAIFKPKDVYATPDEFDFVDFISPKTL